METPEFVIARERPDAPSGHVYFTGQTELVECYDGSVAVVAKTTLFVSEAVCFMNYEPAADWVAFLHHGFFVGVLVAGSDETVIPVVEVPESWLAETLGA